MKLFDCVCPVISTRRDAEGWYGEDAAENFVEGLYFDGLLEGQALPATVITRQHERVETEEWEVGKYTETVDKFAATKRNGD